MNHFINVIFFFTSDSILTPVILFIFFLQIKFSYIQGLINREEGRYQDALNEFKRAKELNPKSPENYKEIGKTL